MRRTIQPLMFAAVVFSVLMWPAMQAAAQNYGSKRPARQVSVQPVPVSSWSGKRAGGHPVQGPIEAGCDCVGKHRGISPFQKGCDDRGTRHSGWQCGCGSPGGCPTCVPPVLPAVVRGIDSVLDCVFPRHSACGGAGCTDRCCAERPSPKNDPCYGTPGHPGCGSPSWFCKIHYWHRKHAYRGCWDGYTPAHGHEPWQQGPVQVWDERVTPESFQEKPRRSRSGDDGGDDENARPMLPPKPRIDLDARYRAPNRKPRMSTSSSRTVRTASHK